MIRTKKLFFENKRTIRIKDDSLESPGPGQILVQAKYSAISAGTEMLFYQGNFPPDIATDISLPSLPGTMSYPMQYGYSLVGKVTAIGKKVDSHLLNKNVFLFHPHQSQVVVPQSEVHLIPPGLDEKSALFLPNMETAINCVMDGRPNLGEKVVTFGQGIVGLLISAILKDYPLGLHIAIDPVKKRREMAKALGATEVLSPKSKKFTGDIEDMLYGDSIGSDNISGADLIFEMSGNPEVLNSVISIAGYHSRIIVGSWYGSKKAQLVLGDKFHRNRLQIISSQVSTIHPKFRGRWTKERRLELAWQWLKKIDPIRLISHQIPFSNAKIGYDLLDKKLDETLQVILYYEGKA